MSGTSFEFTYMGHELLFENDEQAAVIFNKPYWWRCMMKDSGGPISSPVVYTMLADIIDHLDRYTGYAGMTPRQYLAKLLDCEDGNGHS